MMKQYKSIFAINPVTTANIDINVTLSREKPYPTNTYCGGMPKSTCWGEAMPTI